VYDNTAHRRGFRVVAQFIGGELSKAAQTIPDWAAKVFGKELHAATNTRNLDVGANFFLFNSFCVLVLTHSFSCFGARRPACNKLARKIRDFISTKGLAMVQIRCLRGFETKSEAFA